MPNPRDLRPGDITRMYENSQDTKEVTGNTDRDNAFLCLLIFLGAIDVFDIEVVKQVYREHLDRKP